MPSHRLISTAWPEFGPAAQAPVFTAADFHTRLAATRQAMESAGLTHLAVYGDREHCANLLWLCGMDPRFEEALMIIGARAEPLLLTGIECEAYLAISPLFTSGGLRHQRYAPFSLPNIAPEPAPPLLDLLRAEGIASDSSVGCAGWKSLDLPAYLMDEIRCAAVHAVDASALFIDPAQGLRTFATAKDIAWFEYSNILASEGMRRVLQGVREGITDHELVALAGFNGFPQGCHWGLKTGAKRISLASPNGSRVVKGYPLSGNVCYRGSNCCRSGWVAAGPQDLPEPARDYAGAFAGPYFSAMGAWFAALKVDAPAGDLDAAIRSCISPEAFGIRFSAGHLIHFDEWLNSPVWPGSPVPLHSGMLIQSDVIPASPVYSSTRMEDTYALASHDLLRELAAAFPETYLRCLSRRDFMRNVLRLPVDDSVLPLSNLPGIVPPYLLSLDRIFALEP